MNSPGISLPRNAQLWMPGYIRHLLRRRSQNAPKRVWLQFADHFEPLWNQASEELARDRVRFWCDRLPQEIEPCSDSLGRQLKYTFFYAQEEYRPALLDHLANLTARGIADVEVHLHHDGEGEQNFVDRISRFVEVLSSKHGLLHKNGGKSAFGFIHGDWALDNSHPEGKFCGLNNEIQILSRLGCYADFTLPSAPSPTQTRLINTIYWAKDDPARPKSHDAGVPLAAGGPIAGDLLMVPGPLGIRWRIPGRLLPRIDTGEVSGNNPPTEDRVRLWLRTAPRLGYDLFLKLFTHGSQERNSRCLLHGGISNTVGLLASECARIGSELYFVSAWEMWRALEAIRQCQSPLVALAHSK